MANIIGTNGNDTLLGSDGADTINGQAGNDTITASGGNDTVTGGGGNDTITGGGNKDKFVYNLGDGTDIITDFGGIGKGTNPTAAVIAEVDTIKLQDDILTPRNLLLTQNRNNLEITFEGVFGADKLILENFALENLDNLSKSTGATVNSGNILFYGQTSITDSFDVFNANSTQSTIFNKNTVTFLNDLNNNVNGFDTSDDVINGQGGDDKIDGLSGNDLLRGGAGNDTLNGGAGNDTLSGDAGNNTLNGDDGNDILNGAVKVNDTQNTLNGGAGDDTLSTSGLSDNLLSGGDGNDSLSASSAFGTNTLNGGNGDDILTDGYGNDILTGGGGKDEFVYNYLGDYRYSNTVTDFGGVGKGVNPSVAVIAEVDTLIFQGDGLTARNLLLTQNGNNLEISFANLYLFGGGKLILQNFALENLDNLSKSTGATVNSGNILFSGQTSITDSFDVFNANSTQSTIFNKNTVTFLNDLDNNVNGFDNSDDVINGQGGDDIIDGLSGNDLLRGGAGNNTLNGGAGDDTLNVDSLLGNNLLSGGDGNDSLVASGDQYSTNSRSEGNNTLNGGAGNDTLGASSLTGDNLLSGGDGSDSLSVSGYYSIDITPSLDITNSGSFGNNTLNGGAGNDILGASGSTGDNLLSGGDGNDSLSVSGYENRGGDFYTSSRSEGNNTLNGGAGDDTLGASGSTGDNLLSGGDGNDSLDASGSTGDNLLSGGDGNDSFYLSFLYEYTTPSYLVTQTVDGGRGDDLLSADFGDATGGITTIFNATTNIGAITGGSSQVTYKNIESFNILGTAYDDNIVGNDGNDTLSTGSAGKDTIDGGKGDDVLSVDYNDPDYTTTEGITTIFNATTNIGSITAGTNSVSYKNIERFNILGTFYDDNIVGNNGNDTLSTGNSGNDTIDGGKGDDVLSVNFYATAGITTTFDATTNIGAITGGKDRVSYKNIERLNISGTGYDDNIVGNDGNDTLSTGSAGKDTIDGGKGDDVLSVDYTFDIGTSRITTTFNATTNIGSIKAGTTNRVSYKNIERLNILGSGSDDLIVGNSGNDTLSGYYGNDTIIGGAGNDILYAGDTFGFNNYNEGVDTIHDFNAANALIQVSAAGFGGGLSIGSLKTSQFTLGTSATTSNQRFIYDNITGVLYFDQDGSASGFTQVKFAELLGNVTLTENNFVVV